MKNKSHKNGDSMSDERSSRFVHVNAPKPYEGIGRALASAYPASKESALPDSMMSLLDQLK
jgi:hypothetical protein